MDTHEPLHIRMDEEFDKYLNEMKPLVLNLTNKSGKCFDALQMLVFYNLPLVQNIREWSLPEF